MQEKKQMKQKIFIISQKNMYTILFPYYLHKIVKITAIRPIYKIMLIILYSDTTICKKKCRHYSDQLDKNMS